MGSPVSSIIADIFMEGLENKTFAGYPNVPQIWKRFVDDVLAVGKKNSRNDLLSYLYSQHSRFFCSSGRV